VTVLLDGEKLFTLKTDFSNLNDPVDSPPRPTKLGVATNQNSVTFNAIELSDVSGRGKSSLPAATP
jgi:hypothetical protein